MKNLKVAKSFCVVLVLVLSSFLFGLDAAAQTKETEEEKPSVALASALAAACRQNETIFLR
ncbi:MAG: hypothetical protein M1451_04440, partial [Acidobacteria bacterium]|nr:hypothetical protein [Acidobacteriota bacterium]